MTSPEWRALYLAVTGGIPDLPGALCIDQAPKFDGGRAAAAVAAAIATCADCPALDPCRRWADQQPVLVGVIAGRVHYPPRTPPNWRPRKPT
jgi:WhiB family transcriptional regulator, redox-sensing transcriptional regulator